MTTPGELHYPKVAKAENKRSEFLLGIRPCFQVWVFSNILPLVTVIFSPILLVKMATPASLSLSLLAISSLVSASQGLVTPFWRRGTPSTGYYDPNANGGSMLTVSFISSSHTYHNNSSSSKSMGHIPLAKESLSTLYCLLPQIATFWWIHKLTEG